MADLNKDTVDKLEANQDISPEQAASLRGSSLDSAPELVELDPVAEPTFADVQGTPLVMAPEIINAPVENPQDEILRGQPVVEQPIAAPQEGIPLTYEQKVGLKREEINANKVRITQLKQMAQERAGTPEEGSALFSMGNTDPKVLLTQEEREELDLLQEDVAIEEGVLLQADQVRQEKKAGERQQAANTAMSKEAEKEAIELLRHEDYIIEAAQQDTTDIDNQIAGMDQRISDLASRKIDPGRVWKNKSTANKIFAILGAGFAPGDSGLKAIQNEINLDVKAQMADLDNERQSLQMQSKKLGLSAKQMQKIQQPAVAADFIKIESISNAIGNIKSTQANLKPGSPQAPALQDKLRRLEQQRFQLMTRMKTNVQASGGKQRVDDFMINGAKMSKAQKYAAADDHQRDRWSAEAGMVLANKADKLKISDSNWDAQMAALDSLDELMALGNKGSRLSPTDHARVDVLRAALKGDLRISIVGPGALSEPELKILDGIVADPLSFTALKSFQMTKLKTIRSRVEGKLRGTAKSAGVDFGQVWGNRSQQDKTNFKTFIKGN